MGKNQDPGSGIDIPDPQHCFFRYNLQGVLPLNPKALCEKWNHRYFRFNPTLDSGSAHSSSRRRADQVSPGLKPASKKEKRIFQIEGNTCSKSNSTRLRISAAHPKCAGFASIFFRFKAKKSEGVWESQFRRLEKKLSTLYCILCGSY
jgi:hypothetical protein